MVNEWPQYVYFNYSPGSIEGMTEGTEDISNLITIVEQTPFKPHVCVGFLSYLMCVLQMIFRILMKNVDVATSPLPVHQCKDGKPHSNKASSREPKLNRDYPIWPARICQTQQSRLCRKYNWTTTWPYQNGGHPYRRSQCFVHLCLCSLTTKGTWKHHVTCPLVRGIHRWLAGFPHK